MCPESMAAWKNVQRRNLGLKFTIDEKIHYDWARLNETCVKNGENTALLTGYAYDKPIITGKAKGPDVVTVHSRGWGYLAVGST